MTENLSNIYFNVMPTIEDRGCELKFLPYLMESIMVEEMKFIVSEYQENNYEILALKCNLHQAALFFMCVFVDL
jgi:hypothetical protein